MSDWPELSYERWRDTQQTLHRYPQVVGKLRFALSPTEPQWAHVPLYPPAGADRIALHTHDAEQACAGFWPGDDTYPQPAFFAYTWPKPAVGGESEGREP